MYFELVSTNYRIPNENLSLIDKYEGEILGYNNGLYKELDKIDGVKGVDYDGHFGPFIYLTINTGYDNKITREFIFSCISNFIEKAKKEFPEG